MAIPEMRRAIGTMLTAEHHPWRQRGTPNAPAVEYQIAIMFLIAAGTALGTMTVVLLSYLRLFNTRHQFLSERIRKA